MSLRLKSSSWDFERFHQSSSNPPSCEKTTKHLFPSTPNQDDSITITSPIRTHPGPSSHSGRQQDCFPAASMMTLDLHGHWCQMKKWFLKWWASMVIFMPWDRIHKDITKKEKTHPSVWYIYLHWSLKHQQFDRGKYTYNRDMDPSWGPWGGDALCEVCQIMGWIHRDVFITCWNFLPKFGTGTFP